MEVVRGALQDEQDRPVVLGLRRARFADAQPPAQRPALVRSCDRDVDMCDDRALVPVPFRSSSGALVTRTSPAPKRHEWTMFDDTIVDHALARMNYLAPANTNAYTGCYDVSNCCRFITSSMCGMEEVAKVLVTKLLKLKLFPTVCQVHLSEATRGIHCAIVGPEGCGKRTAVIKACIEWRFHVLTVSPETFERNYLWIACDLAARYKPMVIFFDGLDYLFEKPGFADEFKTRIAGDSTFMRLANWNNVWLVFGITRKTDEVVTTVRTFCFPDDVAFVSTPKDGDLVKIAMDVFTRAKVLFSPKMSEEQREDFRAAARESTPRLMTEFAGQVINSAHARASFGQLNRDMSRLSQASPLALLSAGDSNDDSKPMEDKTAETPKTPLQSLPTRDNADPRHRAAEPAVASFACNTDMDAEGVTINWAKDAEHLYSVVESTEAPNGIRHWIIPREGQKVQYFTRKSWMT